MREATVSQLSEAQINEIRKQFQEYDKDNSGEISIDEAEKAFQTKVDEVPISLLALFFDHPCLTRTCSVLQTG